MKILFITRKYPPSVGGMETYSKHLFEALRESGAEVDLYKPKSDLRGRPSVLQMVRFFYSACFFLILHGRKYDVVLLGDYAIAILGMVAKLASFGRLRTVVSLHGNDLYFMRAKTRLSSAYRSLSWLVTRGRTVDAAIANSRAIEAEARLHGIPVAAVVPLATPVVPESSAPTQSDSRKSHLLFTGRLIRYKGLAWFVQNVWPHLDNRYELLVAGQVWDQSEYEALRDIPRIHYLGTIDYQKLPALRASVLACIMPNIPPRENEQDEGFGLVALEAPAVGTPIVASACGGIPDAVANGITGFLLPPLDADAWSACLNGLLDWSESERISFASRAKQHIAEHYNWPLVAQRTLDVLAGHSGK